MREEPFRKSALSNQEEVGLAVSDFGEIAAIILCEWEV